MNLEWQFPFYKHQENMNEPQSSKEPNTFYAVCFNISYELTEWHIVKRGIELTKRQWKMMKGEIRKMNILARGAGRFFLLN